MANKNNGWSMIDFKKHSSCIKDELWFNSETGQTDIYRNHKLVKTVDALGSELEARNYFYDFFENYRKAEKTLAEYLEFSNLKITKLEKAALETIMGMGSYYEESCECTVLEDGKHHLYVDKSCFIGWDIDERDLPGCRGALASLVRKGVLTVFDDECNGKKIQGYYIHQTPKFKKGGFYHELDIPEELIK